jgi:hypothetical protein
MERIEDMLVNQDYVPGTTFMRLSKTGASTRTEVLRALFIVMAQTYRDASATADTRRKFDEFATANGGIKVRLTTSVVPDGELNLICTLYDPSNTPRDIMRSSIPLSEKQERLQRRMQFSEESQRLQSLLMSNEDEAWNQTESMESFVAFLKTLNPHLREYWPKVYNRIGLAWPQTELPDEAGKPHAKRTWWQRLLG